MFRVEGAGFRVEGAGFRVQGSGFRVQGAGCTRGRSASAVPPPLFAAPLLVRSAPAGTDELGVQDTIQDLGRRFGVGSPSFCSKVAPFLSPAAGPVKPCSQGSGFIFLRLRACNVGRRWHEWTLRLSTCSQRWGVRNAVPRHVSSGFVFHVPGSGFRVSVFVYCVSCTTFGFRVSGVRPRQ